MVWYATRPLTLSKTIESKKKQMNEEDKKSFDSRARHNEIRNLIPETSFGRENILIIAENSTIHSLTPNLVMYKPSKTNTSAPIQLKRKRSSL